MKRTLFTWMMAGSFAVVLGAGCGPSNKPATADKPAEPTAKFTTKVTQPEPGPVTDLDTDLLKGSAKKELSEGDKAWQTLQEAIQPPAFPEEWQQKQPSKEEIAAFEKKNGVLAANAAAKVKEFYTKHPDHEMSARAKTMELGLVNAAVRLGNTTRNRACASWKKPS
jgi:hypothetical protein